MDSSMYTQWVQSPIQESSQDDWPKDRPPTANSASTNLDISDFATLADLAGPSTSSITQPFYNPYPPYYMASPYTTMAYGTPWPSTVPLSNYSSLNGATTTASSASQGQQQHSPQQQHAQPPSQQQQQQQQQHIQQQQQQQVQQQSHSSTSHQMMIDPALTMNGGSSSSTGSSSFSHTPPFLSQPNQQQQQQQQQQQSQQAQSSPQLQHQRPQYYNQHIIYPSPYYRQQPQSAPQGTLSPQALLSPSNNMMTISSSSFYSHPTQSQQLQPGPSQQQQLQLQHPQPQSIATPQASTSQASTPTDPPAPRLTEEQREERKRTFQIAIRPFLLPTAFTGAQAVNQLTNLIAEYGATDVEAASRLEILARIRDGAGNHYYRAWSENTTAIDITREWIKAAAKGNNAALVETTMPLLHLIDRLPFTVESLMSSKLGKIIKKLVKDEPSSAIKDMASNLERRWRNMILDIEGSAKAPPENKGNEGRSRHSVVLYLRANRVGAFPTDPKTKKRKLNDPATARPSSLSVKKAAVGSASSTKPIVVKKEPSLISLSALSKHTAPAVKDAKADSSFFSAPKPKAKLPSFKKAPPVQVKKEDFALPSSFDPFQEALKSMKVAARRDSPAVSTPPHMSSAASSADSQAGTGAGTGLVKNGRKRKSVTWATESQLVSIKLIERAVYDDDPVDVSPFSFSSVVGTHIGHSIRDLDRGEGAAMHAHLFEEATDWTEPILVEMPTELENSTRTTRGANSEEKVTQEEREQTALGALYMSPNQIPESPAEPTTVISEEEADKNVKQMQVGAETDAIFWSTEPVAAVPSSVADLVSQLAMSGSAMMVDPTLGGGVGGTPGLDIGGIPQDQLQQLLNALASPYAAGEGGWSGVAGTSFGAEYGQGQGQPASGAGAGGYPADADDANTHHPRWDGTSRGRGRGGRGSRGRGRGDEGGFRPYIKRKPCSFFALGRRALNLNLCRSR
ncbi:hypothetical protein GALMADRAFT_157714 [Galerina marginata CBS 339.88]|uniref:TFIIS N-terminal domain-containing protein n=1 Tax=Galerina marginata (strain CBS 339.88) TaxID=685588 RepID=A0A067T6A3_GALM3|nr:hypothetical protein GALMADRAFT_157714 [Galerina marginata CBS 339.88]